MKSSPQQLLNSLHLVMQRTVQAIRAELKARGRRLSTPANEYDAARLLLALMEVKGLPAPLMIPRATKDTRAVSLATRREWLAAFDAVFGEAEA